MRTVLLPSLGADMTEGTLVKWLKQEGDKLIRGDKIAEIETDKTIVEMEAYHDGFLRKLVVAEGTTAPVGTVIAYIGNKDEPIPDLPIQQETNVAKDDSAPVSAVPETSTPLEPVTSTTPELTKIADANAIAKASPMARSIARELKINLHNVKGTGPAGRITKDDVLKFNPALAKPNFANLSMKQQTVKLDSKDVALTTMRQAIAKTTVKSTTEIPHFQVSLSIDMTAAMEWRSAVNELVKDSGSKVSVNDIVLKAIVGALIENPKWNATYADNSLHFNADVNIGIAIALEAGLMVPAIIGAQKMNMIELSDAAKDLGKRTRDNHLTQNELTKGTFSTSNLGMFDVDTFTAIIVPGQSGILSVGSVKAVPVVREGQIVVRQIMQAVLSADHRVGDGAEAGMLLSSFRNHIENPAKLFFS